LYAEEDMETCFKILNASDERGINTVREDIKDFCSFMPPVGVPFKIVCLDECDHLTRDAQAALRAPMEDYSDNARFVLLANYGSRIIAPIQGRCARFYFKPLNKEEIKTMIDRVAVEKKLTITDNAQDLLIDYCEGDLRTLINGLQVMSISEDVITGDVVESMSDTSVIDGGNFLEIILSDYGASDVFQDTREIIRNLMYEKGYGAIDVLGFIYRQFVGADIESRKKLKIIRAIGLVDSNLISGSSEETQLSSLIAEIISINLNGK
jgi:replication factor C small subunit